MARFFNTTSPCNPEDHYMLPPDARLVRAQLERYIESKLYWVLHATRQTGKTTFLQSWMRSINAGTQAVACYASVERCQDFPAAADAMPAIVSAIREYATAYLDPSLVPEVPQVGPASALSAILGSWAALVAPKPLVVPFDEVDVLQDQSLVSFLRQLRGGFAMRGVGRFPTSIALVGMRDLRDYLIRSKDGVALNPGSPFNIKQDSASLSGFAREDIHMLAGQHSSDTGQVFAAEALDLGLVTKDGGTPAIANPIYRENMARILSQGMQDAIPAPEFRWQKPDGTLDTDALLREFQNFWAQHADIWEEKSDYTEAFPHLLLMAFLQRVINGGGRIEREYAAGRGRVDLAVLYAGSWSIIEIKLVSRHGRESTLNQGLQQVNRYRDTIDRQSGAWLVVFDRTPAGRQKSWEERLSWDTVDTPTGPVTVVGG